MEKQTALFDFISNKLGLSISSQLSQNGGYALQTIPSAEGSAYLDSQYNDTVSYLLLGKSKDQKALADSLYKICNTLRKETDSSLKVYNISVNQPSLVDIEGDFYIWQLQITVRLIN